MGVPPRRVGSVADPMGTTVSSRERLSLVAEVGHPAGAVAHLALARFLDGRHPFFRSFQVTGTAPLGPDDLAVGDGRPVRWIEQTRSTIVLVEGTGWAGVVVRRKAEDDDVATTTIDVYADTRERAADVEELLRKAVPASPATADTMTIRSWSGDGYWTDRAVETPRWDTIRGNYAAAVRPALDRLVGLAVDGRPTGRLILLHGVPGTGKSTFIRGLARAWAPWCAVELLTDLKAALADGSAMDTTLFTPAADHDGVTRPWKVLVVEDAHEIIDVGATGGASDTLTRLLHATDGVVGGQAKVLFLLTTNHRLDRVHPALLRPGRCLAEIEIPPLSAAEATGWLNDGTTVRVPTTLADLYASGRADDVIRHRVAVDLPGQYL